MPRARSNVAATRWSMRLVPVFVLCAFAYATYAVAPYICVNFLYRREHKSSAAVALLVLFLFFFVLTILTYIRTLYATQRNPALVPLVLGPEASRKHERHGHGGDRDVEAGVWVPPDLSPDSPGLETFYSKDIFLCEADGRPKWCSECRQWKPDRASHSRELNRCVRKMDHQCPWVGGMVCETSFNFFIQFTVYCSITLAVCIATGGYCVHLQLKEGQSVDGRIIALLVAAGFFIVFSSGLAMTSLRFLFTNMTNIEMLNRNHTYHIAVRIPRNSPPSSEYHSITYPLSRDQWQSDENPTCAQPSRSDLSTRDRQATRTFAILQTEAGANPFDLGFCQNFQSIMGYTVFEWFLPIRQSPCSNHDSMESDYKFGELIHALKKQYGVPDLSDKTNEGIEMHGRGERG